MKLSVIIPKKIIVFSKPFLHQNQLEYYQHKIFYFWNMDKIDLLFETRKHWSNFQINTLIALIYKVEKEDSAFKSYKLKAKDILVKKLSFEELKSETQSFLYQNYETQVGNKLTQLPLFSSIVFIIGEGIVEVSLHPLFKAYFLELKERYTLVTLMNLLKFKSRFSKKLYLIFIKSNQKCIEVTIAKLKEELDLTTSYQDYNTFKKRVILQSQKELYNTDMAFFFEEVKKSRKVDSIKFFLIEIQSVVLSIQQEKLQNKLVKETKITNNQAKRIAIKFTSQEIYSTLYLIKDAEYSGRIKTSLGGYTVSVFNKISASYLYNGL